MKYCKYILVFNVSLSMFVESIATGLARILLGNSDLVLCEWLSNLNCRGHEEVILYAKSKLTHLILETDLV